MNYCVNVRMGNEIIKSADQIFFGHDDTGAIIDYLEKYPNKTIIYEAGYNETLDYTNLTMYNEKQNGNFYIALPYWFEDFDKLQSYNLKYYINHGVSTMVEVKNAIDFGVSYLLIRAPLTHKLDLLKKFNIPLRMSPNSFHVHPLSELGLISGWVRPEDVELYEQYIDTFEIYGHRDFVKASLRIYQLDKKWEGNLKFLVPGLKADVDHRTIPAEVVQSRLNCGQKCLEGWACRQCYQLPRLSAILKEVAANKKV